MKDIKKITQYLAEFISQTRKDKIEEVLSYRTNNLTLVLEDIYQPHNASATIRTCDCLGLQNVHVIEKKNNYKVNRNVTQGASYWVDLHKYKQQPNPTKHCIDALKADGYKIIATSLGKNTISLEEIDLTQKHAIMFGTEETGLSSYAIENADYCLKLPMHGFTQSYNISVSVAICFSNLVPRLHKLNNWQLTESELEALRYKWYRRCLKNPEEYEKRFWEEGNV